MCQTVPRIYPARVAGAVVLALVSIASPAGAQMVANEGTQPAPLTMVRPEGLPFSGFELQRALLARLWSPDGKPDERGRLPRIELEPGDAGTVIVRLGARRRAIAVGNRSGPAAARVVALVVAELMDEIESAPISPVPVPPVAAAKRPSSAIAALPPPNIAKRIRTLSLTTGIVRGTSSEEYWHGTLDVDLVFSRGPLRLAPSIGLTLVPTRGVGAAAHVSFTGFAARMLGGMTVGPVDLLAGPVVSPFQIAGTQQHAGVLVGGEATALVTAALAEHLRLLVAGRLDAFANRVRVAFVDGRAFATPRVGLGVAVGLAWDWTS